MYNKIMGKFLWFFINFNVCNVKKLNNEGVILFSSLNEREVCFWKSVLFLKVFFLPMYIHTLPVNSKFSFKTKLMPIITWSKFEQF